MNTIEETAALTSVEKNTPAPLTKEEKKRLKKQKKLEKKLDRKEGRRVKTVIPMNAFMPFIMKKRNDACNFFEDRFDVAAAEQYIYEKRADGWKGFGMMHLLVAAYTRCIAEFPGVNRFIRGQRIYARYNIEVALVVKRAMKLNEEETCVKFFPKASDTAEEVFRKMNTTLEAATANKSSDFDKAAKFFASLPRFLLRGVVNLLHFMDYYHLIPRFLTRLSPFHGSMIVTSMGSLGIPPVYHHIYNFGNLPLFLSYGKVEKEYVLNADGSVSEKHFLPLKIVCDERICDGHYYASFFKAMRHYFAHPELLDTPPAEVKKDIP